MVFFYDSILVTGDPVKIWVKNVASERIQKTKVADEEELSYLPKGKTQKAGRKSQSEGKPSPPFPRHVSSGWHTCHGVVPSLQEAEPLLRGEDALQSSLSKVFQRSELAGLGHKIRHTLGVRP